MKELVEVLAQSLVDHPEEVSVTETENEGEIILELKVAPDDMGKVIGKQGRIAKAIRAMVRRRLPGPTRKLLWKSEISVARQHARFQKTSVPEGMGVYCFWKA